MTDLDPRVNAFRPDLADAALRNSVRAADYVEGNVHRVAAGRAPLFQHPSGESRVGSELLFGETVSVFENSNGWAWVQNKADGYVGYLRGELLDNDLRVATHTVSVLRTYVYSEPDIKSPVRNLLSMNSLLCQLESTDEFMRVAEDGWIWAAHAAQLDECASDHAEVALRFLGTPYLWGGRTSIGLDCSGLVQMALLRCGKSVPRDSDMQAVAIGAEVAYDDDDSALAHGDLVFWPGHVGIWLRGGEFVHANAADMTVSKGVFAEIAEHVSQVTGGGVSGVRRP